MTVGMSPDAGPRPGAEQAAPRPKVERHPIKAAGEILKAARGVLEERRMRQMSPADREKAVREREKRQETSLDERVDVKVIGGERDQLTPQAREHIRQAQQELINRQGVDISKLSGEERRKKLQELRGQSRIVVADGGKQIMLIQGDQNGYDVDPQTGKITLKLIKENVEETVNGVKQTKQIERNSQIQVARASFETSEETVRGRTVKVEDVRYLRSTEPSLVTLDKAGDGNGNAFAGLGEQMVTVKLSKMDIAGTRVNIVDVGKADVDSSVRALRAVADAREKGGRSQAEITIAGAGADLLKVGDKKGKGVLELGNITSRSQIEAPKAPAAPGAPAERQIVDLVLTADEQRQFNQLPREQQIAVLRGRAGALPAGVDTGLLDFRITVQGTGELPEDAVILDDATREQLRSRQATALHRTREIIEGTMRPEDLREVSDRSELALIIGRGTDGYRDPATAMISANQFVGMLRQSVESQFADPNNTRTRQQIARSIIDTHFSPEDRSPEAIAAVDRLAVDIGNRTPDEVVADIKAARRPEEQKPETFRAGLVDQLRGTEGYRGLNDDQLGMIVDAIRGEAVGVYTSNDQARRDIGEAIRNGTIIGERPTIQAALDAARANNVDVSESQRLLDAVVQRPASIGYFGEVFEKYSTEGTINEHRQELLDMLNKITVGQEGVTEEMIGHLRTMVESLTRVTTEEGALRMYAELTRGLAPDDVRGRLMALGAVKALSSPDLNVEGLISIPREVFITPTVVPQRP